MTPGLKAYSHHNPESLLHLVIWIAQLGVIRTFCANAGWLTRASSSARSKAAGSLGVIWVQAGKEAGRSCAQGLMDFNRPTPDSDYGVSAPCSCKGSEAVPAVLCMPLQGMPAACWHHGSLHNARMRRSLPFPWTQACRVCHRTRASWVRGTFVRACEARLLQAWMAEQEYDEDRCNCFYPSESRYLLSSRACL